MATLVGQWPHMSHHFPLHTWLLLAALETQHLGQGPLATSLSPHTKALVFPYPGFRHQHVVPQDGGPAAGELADVGDHHNRQRGRLQGDKGLEILLTRPPRTLRGEQGTHCKSAQSYS